MNSYNLLAPMGAAALNYPHYTKWRNGIVHVVTSPNNKIQVADTVFVALETKNPMTGEPEVSYYNKPQRVKEILEERDARGVHKTDFKPLFQKIKVD